MDTILSVSHADFYCYYKWILQCVILNQAGTLHVKAMMAFISPPPLILSLYTSTLPPTTSATIDAVEIRGMSIVVLYIDFIHGDRHYDYCNAAMLEAA